MNIRADNPSENQRVKFVPYLAHPDEPMDRYESYMQSGPKSTDKSHNRRNLFDDSNEKDRKWLALARKYLRELKN